MYWKVTALAVATTAVTKQVAETPLCSDLLAPAVTLNHVAIVACRSPRHSTTALGNNTECRSYPIDESSTHHSVAGLAVVVSDGYRSWLFR